MSPQTNPESDAYRLRFLRESLGMTRAEAALETGYSVRQLARCEAGEAVVRPAVLKALQRLQPRADSQSHDAFSFIDLFAGIFGSGQK